MSLTDPFGDPLASPLTVTTDYADYAPGTTAIFTASNLAVGGTVEFSVAHVTAGGDGVIGTADDALFHDLSGTTAPWTVTDGGAGDLDGLANGQVVTGWYVNIDALDQTLQVTAADGMGATATAVFTDATVHPNPILLTTANSTATVNGAVFNWLPPTGSGTGNYDPFLATGSGDGDNEGFNSSSGGNPDVDYSKTTDRQISSLPIKVVGGIQYYEFRVDVNEGGGSNSVVALNSFKLYVSDGPAVLGDFNNTTDSFPATGGSQPYTLAYDLDGGADGDVTVIMNQHSSGSGTDDYSALIPVSAFGSASPSDYITMYVNWGGQPKTGQGADPYTEDGGFEEWKTETAATITGIKFLDSDEDGVLDAGEDGIGDVTVFIDADHDGQLDAGEASTVTAADGSFGFFGLSGAAGETWIDEVVPDGFHETTGTHQVVTIDSDTATTYAVEIGNAPDFIPNPELVLEKTGAWVDGDADGFADVGETIVYTFSVQNTGNVTLNNVTVTDPLVTVSGGPTMLDVGETDTTTFTGTYVITQADIDAGNVHNVATADSTESPPDDDDNDAPLPRNPSISLDKQVSVDGGDNWFDIGDVADNPSLLGSAAIADPEVLQYRFIVTNTGNVTLTDVTLTDDPAVAGLDGDIGTLAPGASTEITVVGTFNAGENPDTATVTSAEGPTDTDDASYYGATPGVELDKGVSVDGETFLQFGDDDTVPTILVGHTVTFEAIVDNTDSVIDVTDATVSDDNPSADFVGPETVEAGSTGNVYDGVSTTAVAGLQTDTATFHGTATDSAGHTSDWTDSDTASYFGADPSVTILKEVSVDGGENWVDANEATGPLLLESGPAPQFRFTVTNTGNVELTNLTLHDSDFDLNGEDLGTDLAIASLAANGEDGDEFSTTITVDWAAGQHTDTATVNGSFTDDVGNIAELEEEDSANYFGSAPDIDIVKTGVFADEDDDGFADVGETITYTFTVTNSGNVTLHNVDVEDTVGGVTVVGDPLATLAVGASDSTTFTGSYTIIQADIDAGHFFNTATATSTEDSDSDDEDVDLPQNPAIQIDKKTTGLDPNGVSHTGDGIAIAAGNTVTWTYTVTNIGNVALSDISVSDDNGSAADTGDDFDPAYVSGDAGVIGVLEVGETWIYSASGTAAEAPYSNIGTVDAIFHDQHVGDDDASSYIGSFKPGFTGLTAGFWSQHLAAWDYDLSTNKNNANLVGSGVLSSKDVLEALPNDVDGSLSDGFQKGIMLGDANANGLADVGEATLTMTLDIAKQLVSANISDKSDARLNLLQQAVAAQLNIYNQADDPGQLSAITGDDLLGTAVKWLTGELDRADGNDVPSAWNIDNNGTPGVLTQTTEIVLNAKGITFTDGAVKTSSYDWNGDFIIDESNSYFGGAAVYASGEDLKDALEAFNQGILVTSADGNWIGINSGGVISDAHTNDQDGLWAVLINDLGIGHHA
jgi:uncharacterized repeat protein (TIGR01451 family)